MLENYYNSALLITTILQLVGDKFIENSVEDFFEYKRNLGLCRGIIVGDI